MANQPWWDAPEDSKESAPAQASLIDSYQDTAIYERPQEATPVSLIDSYDEAPKPKASTQPASVHGIKNIILSWMRQNLNTVLWMLLGFAIGLGILVLGFWKTALIVLCLLAGYLYGSYKDGNPRLLERIRRFIERYIDDNPLLK